MKRQATVGLFVFAVLCIASVLAASESGRAYSVSFSDQALRADERQLAEDAYAGTSFQLVTMEGLDLSGELGEPCLPVKVVHVYVPRGKAVGRVVIESQQARSLPGQYLVMPGQMEIPTNSVEPAEPVLPDPKVYALAEPYPASPVEVASVGAMAGRKIASIRVYPLQYVPAERKLLFNDELSFRLELVDADDDPVAPLETRNVTSLRNAIIGRMVENAGEVEADFPLDAAPLEGPTAVEYLVICHENHVDELAPLLEWKTRKGVPAAAKTWQEITATYSGRDNAEKFRNCINDYYLNHSTMWVTITGSSIKAYSYLRGCYCNVWGTLDEGIPCDLYFSDLDGTWNSDNDAYWGETTDGTDLYPDVYVGRLPENTGAQCSTAVRKVLTYEGCYSLHTDYQLKMLFMGEWLDGETDAAINKNMIDNESVPARFDPIQKLYESSGNLSKTAAMAALNSGKGIVNHDGHGNVTIISIGNEVLSTDDFEALTNAPRYTVFYTLACDPAAFDGPMGCLGRSFVESVGGGGFFVGNSRYGWYSPGASGYGTGDLYDRQFFKSMFVRGNTNLGVIHADAKVQRIPYSGDDDTDRWAQFSLNLLGDPETPVWLDTPKALSASHPTEIGTGASTFTVSATSSGSGVSGARVCLWKGDDLYLVGETASGGSVTFGISPADTGTMLVTATKNGYLPYQGSAHVEDALSGVAGLDPGPVTLTVTPNPVSGSATAYLSLPRSARQADRPVVVSIYDARGRVVASFAAQTGSASRVKITWDGRTSSGEEAPSGIYFLKASCDAISAQTKLVMLR
jgi:hypothetical protein